MTRFTGEELGIVAIVPARGNSKRLPRKNVLPLAGKPLLEWTLDAAKASGIIDLIVVTSDNDEILNIAQQSKVTPIRRPDHLASDTATSIDTVLHALEELSKLHVTARRVMLLQPTSPLRTSQDICDAEKKMNATNSSSLISVCEMEHSPLWSNILPDDGNLKNFLRKEVEGKRSQDLPIYYRINGAIFFTKTDELMSKKSFFTEATTSLVMPKERSIDIDSEFDFLIAECLMKIQKCY